MMTGGTGFTTSNVQWTVPRKSVTNGTDETTPTLIDQLDVACNRCSHNWTASHHGPGQFIASLVHIRLICPSCGHEDAVPLKQLQSP